MEGISAEMGPTSHYPRIMSAATPTQSLTNYPPVFAKHGIMAHVASDRLIVTLGPQSGNLAVLTVAVSDTPLFLRLVGAKLSELISVGILGRMPHIVTIGQWQYFFRMAESDKTRQLSPDISVQWSGEIATWPTSGHALDSGKFSELPMLTWAEYSLVIEVCTGQGDTLDELIQAVPETTAIDLVYQTMALTQDNTALVFEDQFKDLLRYCKEWGQWLHWQGAYWKAEKTDMAFDWCRILARKMNRTGTKEGAKASFATGVERFIRASRTFAVTSEQWDSEPWLFNTPAGTLNLRTDTLSPAKQSDHITKSTRIAPKRGPHPIFDRFLCDITLEDAALVQYLQISLGACISGAIQDHFLLFWYGVGRNGKNTLGDLVSWILGDYSKVIPAETLLSHKAGPQHPTDIANLRGLRLAISSEVSEGAHWDEAKLKRLTGDTELSGRFMGKDLFTFQRTHKHLVYGNHRPMLRIVDQAIKSRLHIVPFKADFSQAFDPDMTEKLRAEAPQILQWLIDGHAMWLERGSLAKCSAVQAETDSYFAAQSTVEMWVAECCYTGVEGDREQASPLYNCFKSWKEARGEHPISQTRWGEWMTNRYDKQYVSGRLFYMRVSLKPEFAFGIKPQS